MWFRGGLSAAWFQFDADGQMGAVSPGPHVHVVSLGCGFRAVCLLCPAPWAQDGHACQPRPVPLSVPQKLRVGWCVAGWLLGGLVPTVCVPLLGHALESVAAHQQHGIHSDFHP